MSDEKRRRQLSKERWIVRDLEPIPAAEMAGDDEAVVAGKKSTRGVVKGKFTTARKTLISLIERGAELDIIKEAYDLMQEAFAKLELAYEDYIVAARIDLDVDVTEAGYLDQATTERIDAVQRPCQEFGPG